MYIPAFVRRYPFVFAQDKEAKNFILHVDERFEGMNEAGRGERLFDSTQKKLHTKTQYVGVLQVTVTKSSVQHG